MIFLSYCHAQSEAADQLEAYLKNQHIRIMRDRREMKKNDSISDFMSRISRADFAILLISDDYLRSYYCLHEALLAFQNRHMRNIIPVIFPDADCLAPGSGSEYIRHWYDQMWKLEHAVGGLPPQLAVEQLKKLRKVENYCINLGEFLEYVQDNNSICFGQGGGWLEEAYRCLCERILSREIRPGKVAPAPSASIRISADPILSIDFGTSYTLASVLDLDHNSHLIPDNSGNQLLHSTIVFTDSGHYRIGANGHNTLRHIKRLIGSRDTVPVNGEEVSIRLLIAMILKSVIRNAEEYLGRRISRVLMSLPVDFSTLKKKVLLESAELAGVHVRRFIPESSIEALLWDSDIPDNEARYAIFIDLGGGTLDVTLAECGDGISEILYVTGDHHFGSVDFTACLEQLLRKKLTDQYGVQPGDLTALAEQAKRNLGTADSVNIIYPHFTKEGNVSHLDLQITAEEYEAAAGKLLQRFDRILIQLRYFLIHDLTNSEERFLNRIFLTGQGTKLQMLRRRIEAAFPTIPIIDAYQENAVIRGLSVQSGVLQGMYNDLLLLNSFPSSLYMNYGEDVLLLDAGWYIPTIKHTALEFSPDQLESGMPIAFEVYEKTVSNDTHTLFRTQFIPQVEKKYEISVEFDADSTGTLHLLEFPDDGKKRPHIRASDGLYTGLRTEAYNVLYRCDF